jgi:IMP dehydrogenase
MHYYCSCGMWYGHHSLGVKHGFQDIGACSLSNVHERRIDGRLKFEIRSAAAIKEGGINNLHSYEKKLFV